MASGIQFEEPRIRFALQESVDRVVVLTEYLASIFRSGSKEAKELRNEESELKKQLDAIRADQDKKYDVCSLAEMLEPCCGLNRHASQAPTNFVIVSFKDIRVKKTERDNIQREVDELYRQKRELILNHEKVRLTSKPAMANEYHISVYPVVPGRCSRLSSSREAVLLRDGVICPGCRKLRKRRKSGRNSGTSRPRQSKPRRRPRRRSV
jgi:hypothetical protein